MPTYAYRCQPCGSFDAVAPMARSAEPAPCPTCGDPSRRLMSPPAVRQLSGELSRALGAAERSGSAPAVVSAVPSRGRRSNRTTDPRHAALPRP